MRKARIEFSNSHGTLLHFRLRRHCPRDDGGQGLHAGVRALWHPGLHLVHCQAGRALQGHRHEVRPTRLRILQVSRRCKRIDDDGLSLIIC